MPTIDELIRKLQDQLIEPSPYEFEGWYEEGGENKSHSGIFLVDKNLKCFAGEICDPNSIFPKHIAKGEFFVEDGIIVMKFVKIPPSELYAPVCYELRKVEKNKEIIGEYEGVWFFPESTMQLGTGYDIDGAKVTVQTRPAGRTSKAGLKLYETT